MKRTGLRLAIGLLLATKSPLSAQPGVMAGGVTDEICTGQGQISAITVTPLSAYAFGQVVGGLITIPAMSRAGHSGILQSVRLNIKSVQTAAFDVYQFQSLPTAPFIDRAPPALVGSDFFLVRPPIRLTTPYSDFGNMTVYGTDAITGARKAGPMADYFLIITKGAPTFATPVDVQLCVSYLMGS